MKWADHLRVTNIALRSAGIRDKRVVELIKEGVIAPDKYRTVDHHRVNIHAIFRLIGEARRKLKANDDSGWFVLGYALHLLQDSLIDGLDFDRHEAAEEAVHKTKVKMKASLRGGFRDPFELFRVIKKAIRGKPYDHKKTLRLAIVLSILTINTLALTFHGGKPRGVYLKCFLYPTVPFFLAYLIEFSFPLCVFLYLIFWAVCWLRDGERRKVYRAWFG